MKKVAGLWINHKKAVIIVLTDQGVATRLRISKAEKQLRHAGNSPLQDSNNRQQVAAIERPQKAFTGHLSAYYDAVIACIHDAKFIRIFGPGETKGELKKQLIRNNFSGRIVDIETVDKMTDRQIMAKVRQYLIK